MEPSKNRCGNCKHVFCLKRWDCEDEFYCALNDIEERPLCGSALMDESFFPNDGKPETFEKNMNAWDDWAESREVCDFGCCEEFEVEEIKSKEE